MTAEQERAAIRAGDRVRLTPSDSWTQPMRGWAERERMATVHKVFTPLGASSPTVSVRFDRTRAKGPAGLYYFKIPDLIVERLAHHEGKDDD
jgi:hypothetical protein